MTAKNPLLNVSKGFFVLIYYSAAFSHFLANRREIVEW